MNTEIGTLPTMAPVRGLAASPTAGAQDGDRSSAMLRRLAPMFAALGLAAADAQALEREARARLVPQGQMVFMRHDVAHVVVALLQGDVALGVALGDGQFRPERLVHAPAWLDLGSAWLEGTHALDARALSAVTVAEVPLDAMLPMVERRSTLARPLISALAREVRDLTLNTHELMHKDAPARLAAWLHQRCGPRPGAPEQGVVQLHERKRDIASQLAITPETLSRLMRSFMQQGVIEVSGYTVLVLDPKALERMARDEVEQPVAG
jgi:CRP-like cAMP-binding protein